MRYELTDYEWTAIKPFLPNKPRGVPRVNERLLPESPTLRFISFDILETRDDNKKGRPPLESAYPY